MSLEANRLSGGTIRDGARNNAVLSHAPVAADSRHQVDGVKPTLASSDGAVVNGTTLTLAYGEPLDSSSVPATDDFTVTGGSETRTVTGVRVSGSAVFLTLSSAVADGESRLRVNYEPRIESDPGHRRERRGPVEQQERHEPDGRHDGTRRVDGFGSPRVQGRTGPTAWTRPSR